MKTLLLIMKLFPLLLSAVKAVEEAIPLPGQGKRKLELVLDTLKSAYDAGDELLRLCCLRTYVALRAGRPVVA